MGVACRAHDSVSGGTVEKPRVPPPGGLPDLVAAYQRYHRQLLAQCMAIVRQREDAEDAVQETFARATAQGSRLSGELLPYLSTVARNVCIDMLRQRKRCGPEIDQEHPDHRRGPEPDAVDRFLIEQTLLKLSTRDRVLLAHTYAGFAYEEISHRTGLSAKAVSVAIARARAHSRRVAAAVASVLLPVGVRRFLQRGSRILNSSPQVATAAVAGFEQGGLLAASLIVGLVTLGPGGAVVTHTARAALMVARPGGTSVALGGSNHLSAAVGAAPSGSSTMGAHPGRSSGGAPPAALDLAFSSVPGHQARQQDTIFQTMTPSPQFASDETIYASGNVLRGCANPSGCPALFRSQDGGSSWTQWNGVFGYLGGRVILPATYPQDPDIYVQSPAGLQRAAGGRGTLATVVPVAAPAAPVPASTTDDTEIAVASSTIEIYSARTGLVTPGPTFPAGVLADDMAFVDATHVVVTGHRQLPTLDGVVLLCTLGDACRQTEDFTGQTLLVGATPSAGAAGVTVVYSAQHVYVSNDGGASYAAASIPAGLSVSAVSAGEVRSGGGVLAVAAYSYGAAGKLRSSVLLSANGAPFAEVPSLPAPQVELDSLLVLPGRLLAALSELDASNRAGLRCSTDGGGSWRTAC